MQLAWSKECDPYKMLLSTCQASAAGHSAPLCPSPMPQAGKLPPANWATVLGNNAPFQLSSFALSLLLVFRQVRLSGFY